ncbi:hypothetical protein GCM10020369_15530 [Cryptosporangium minutisporangium]|uniref:Uncharacterized protein n=1 Tax=Cryptosporangium minutisporangium TaxID=113569 RepID=A0ABP6SUE4_9ACTN
MAPAQSATRVDFPDPAGPTTSVSGFVTADESWASSRLRRTHQDGKAGGANFEIMIGSPDEFVVSSSVVSSLGIALAPMIEHPALPIRGETRRRMAADGIKNPVSWWGVAAARRLACFG